jgi:hypothetical protein
MYWDLIDYKVIFKKLRDDIIPGFDAFLIFCSIKLVAPCFRMSEPGGGNAYAGVWRGVYGCRAWLSGYRTNTSLFSGDMYRLPSIAIFTWASCLNGFDRAL